MYKNNLISIFSLFSFFFNYDLLNTLKSYYTHIAASVTVIDGVFTYVTQRISNTNLYNANDSFILRFSGKI